MRPEWDQLGNRPIMFGDDESFACFHPLEQPGEMGFCFESANFRHGAGLLMGNNIIKPDTSWSEHSVRSRHGGEFGSWSAENGAGKRLARFGCSAR